MITRIRPSGRMAHGWQTAEPTWHVEVKLNNGSEWASVAECNSPMRAEYVEAAIREFEDARSSSSAELSSCLANL